LEQLLQNAFGIFAIAQGYDPLHWLRSHEMRNVAPQLFGCMGIMSAVQQNLSWDLHDWSDWAHTLTKANSNSTDLMETHED
jgi:hypothetical protein